MARKLTALAVTAFRAKEDRYEVPDGGCRGLYLLVQPSGKRRFCVRYRFKGVSKKLTLDPGLTLAQARAVAAAALLDVEQGNDPAILKFDARAKAAKVAADVAADTIEARAATFIAQYVEKRTGAENQRQARYVFDKIVLPKWHGRTVHDIKRKDIIALVEKIAEDRPIMANRALGHLSKFFSWLCERDQVAASPCHGVRMPSKEHARDRILADAEINALWQALDAVGGMAGNCIKMMLLTGQRRSEVAGMRRSEISGDLWTLPAQKTKNHKGHDVPLSRQALELIEQMPDVGDVIFTIDGARPIRNFSRIKLAVDKIMKPEQPYVWHDLRRSAASGMARLGVQLPVIEKVLNHSSGSFRGIVGVYQRHNYADEKRTGLQRWADHVEAVVRGGPVGRVIKLWG